MWANKKRMPVRRTWKKTWGIGRKLAPRRARPAPMTSIQEIKSFDCAVTPGNLVIFSAPPAFAEPAVAFAGYTVINKVLQGAAFYNRIGAKVVFNSIVVNAQLIADAATVVTDVRMVLVYDKQANAAAPAFADVFYCQPTAGTPFSAGLNMTNRSRFTIMADRYFTLDAAQALTKHVRISSSARWETEYRATGDTIGDITTGAFLLFAWAGTQVGAGDVSLDNCVARLRYYD